MCCPGIRLATSKACTPSKLKWRSAEAALLPRPVGAACRTCFVAVSLQDSAGRSSVREQQFTLEDDLIPGFGLVQSFLLLTDHYILGRAAFIFTILMNVGGLTAFRFMRLSVTRGEPPLLTGSEEHSVPPVRSAVKSGCSALLFCRPARSRVLSAPAGQQNRRLLLLSAAVQPVHGRR